MGRVYITPDNAIRRKAKGTSKKKRRSRKPKKMGKSITIIDEKQLAKKIRKSNRKKAKKLAKRLKRYKSIFKGKVSDIQRFIETNDSDNAIDQAQRQLLLMLIELIPIAEDKYREFGNERAAYALNSLVSQIRELISDIRSEEDSSQLVQKILNNILHPTFLLLGQNLVDNMYHLRKQIEIYVKPEDMKIVNTRVNESAKNMASYLEEQYKHLMEKIPETMELK